ncbi:uncharacterized protein LOC141692452 [Apium graveolens]|uniref:uncharacterized protein LOC141692452 n=1 Tax=Apium graveolens TaxID=4045 RepID=UPI003D7B1E92
MEEAGENCKYLGLPNMLNKSKGNIMAFLKDKVRNRMLSWEGRCISQGGKETLVKSVAHSLPTYAMSLFLLSVDITKDFERIILKFWWNWNRSDRKGIHWMSWSILSKHKLNGGRDFNLAMLGKQAWRFLTKPDSLEEKGVILAGIRWKVGSGQMIDIVNQPWLLDDNNPYVTSNHPTLTHNKVSSLVSTEYHGWDEDILRDLFNERDQ